MGGEPEDLLLVPGDEDLGSVPCSSPAQAFADLNPPGDDELAHRASQSMSM
jgi:hypothetical protein